MHFTHNCYILHSNRNTFFLPNTFWNRWWKLREAVAGGLLTRTFRMLLVRNRFITLKTGTILLQSNIRGRAVRRDLAAVKIQTQFRRRKCQLIYLNLKSATISLQCKQRLGMAKKVLAELKHEQKDIGKLKQNNEKLKSEMASLKAMLAAQAKGDANKAESEKELKAKEAEIKRLEKRIKQLEEEIEKEKDKVKKLESQVEKERIQVSKHKEQISVLTQQNQNLMKNPPSPRRAKNPSLAAPNSPGRAVKASSVVPKSPKVIVAPILPVPVLNPPQPQASAPVAIVSNEEFSVDSKALEEQRSLVSRLEEELERERAARRETDGEVIKLRAQISGVKLNEDDVKALLPSDEDIKSSVILPAIDPIDMQIVTNTTSDTGESDDR